MATPRLPSAIEGTRPTLETVWAHTPTLMDSFWAMFGALWADPDTIDLKELIRIRSVRRMNCVL